MSENIYIPQTNRNDFDKKSVGPFFGRFNKKFELAAEAIEQGVSARRLVGSQALMEKAASDIAAKGAKQVSESGMTKAEAYNSAMENFSGGPGNKIDWGPAFSHQGKISEEHSKMIRILNESHRSSFDYESEVLKAANLDRELGRKPSVFERIEKAYEATRASSVKLRDYNSHLEAAILGIDYNEYVKGDAHNKIVESNSEVVVQAINRTAEIASNTLRERYGFTEGDINKAERIYGNDNWQNDYPEEPGEREVLSRSEYENKVKKEKEGARFEKWKQGVVDDSPERARILDDNQLYAEFYASVLVPDEKKLKAEVEINDRYVKSALFEERVLNERSIHLSTEEKIAEFNANGDEYERLYRENTEKVRKILLDKEAMKAEAPEAEVPEAEVPEVEVPEAGVPESEVPEAGVPESEVPEAEVPEAEVPEAEVPEAEVPEVEVPEVEVTEAGVPESEVPESEVPEVEAPEAEAPESEVPEPEVGEKSSPFLNNLEKQRESAPRPREMGGSNINLKTTPEKGKEQGADIPTSIDGLTEEQKLNNKKLGINGKNVESDLASLKAVQQRMMLMDHLQNTPEGKKELEAYIAARAGRLQENVGLKGAKLHDKTLSVMMQMPTNELEEEFPESARALREEREGLDVQEELAIYKSNNPSVANSPEEEKNVVRELQFQKQVDDRLGPVGGMSLKERLLKGAKYGLTALAVGSAIASGPVGIATFIGAKVATNYVSKLVQQSEGMDGPVDNALIKNGLVSEEEIKKSKDNAIEKTNSKSWKGVLTKVALVAAGVGIGLAAGSVDFDSVREGIVELANDASELFRGTEIPNQFAGATDLADEVLASPAPEVSEEAIEAARSVAEGPGNPEVSEEAIEAAREVAGGPDAPSNQGWVPPEIPVADGPGVQELSHTVQPGDTGSNIAYNYLSERGISVSASELYGPDGILEQVGLNTDSIEVGQDLDLTKLEEFAQAREQGMGHQADPVSGSSPTAGDPVEVVMDGINESQGGNPDPSEAPESPEVDLEEIFSRVNARIDGEYVPPLHADGTPVDVEAIFSEVNERLGINQPPGSEARANFLNELDANRGIEQASMPQATNFMDQADALTEQEYNQRLGDAIGSVGPEGGTAEFNAGGRMEAVEVGAEFTASSQASGANFMDQADALTEQEYNQRMGDAIASVGPEGGAVEFNAGGRMVTVDVGAEFQTEGPANVTNFLDEADALNKEELNQRISDAMSTVGPEGGVVEFDAGGRTGVLTVGPEIEVTAPSVESEIDSLVNEAPPASSPSGAISEESLVDALDQARREGGFVQVTMSDAGVSASRVDELPHGLSTEDLRYPGEDDSPSNGP